MRHLPTDADILEACYWRVAGVSAEQVRAEMETTRQWLNSLPSFDLIQEDDPATIQILDHLKRPSDRRSTWGLLIALIALESHANDDRALFYRAGGVVIQIYSQASRRASRPSGGDSLSQLVSASVTDHPDASTEQIVSMLFQLAGNHAYPVLVDFDEDSQLLTYQADPESESLRDVGYVALCRRVQRLRKVVTQPAWSE